MEGEKKYARGLDNSGNIEGSINGLFTPPPRQRPPPAATLTPSPCLPPSLPRQPTGAVAARHSTVQRDCGGCWTGVSGRGRVGPQGALGCRQMGGRLLLCGADCGD